MTDIQMLYLKSRKMKINENEKHEFSQMEKTVNKKIQARTA
jgi:hypothetical protein